MFKDNKITEEIENLFYILDTEINIRVESIITDLHKYRDEFRKELTDLKSKYTKYGSSSSFFDVYHLLI